ncbi:TPA: hypothetical protein I8Z04_000991 [Legionella pneumophila]|nr:hypothetical protein [Legionella pneumophila]
MNKKKKQPKVLNTPAPDKTPKFIERTSNDADSISWSFSMIDNDGPWGFNSICRNRLHELLTSELKNKESLNWAQLKQSGSHNVEKYQLIKDAQERLCMLRLEDLDELFSLRISGKERIWGIRHGNILKIMWWDPDHEICPSHKKNT